MNCCSFVQIVHALLLSRILLLATPWTVAHQATLFMGFPRQEYWIGLLFPSPGDLLDPGIEPRSPALQADSLLSEPPAKSWCRIVYMSNLSGLSFVYFSLFLFQDICTDMSTFSFFLFSPSLIRTSSLRYNHYMCLFRAQTWGIHLRESIPR